MLPTASLPSNEAYTAQDMLNPAGHTDAHTLALMLQEQLDAINNEIKFVTITTYSINLLLFYLPLHNQPYFNTSSHPYPHFYLLYPYPHFYLLHYLIYYITTSTYPPSFDSNSSPPL